MRLDFALADTSALLAIVGVLPIEAPEVDDLYATDSSLVEAIAVLRSFHDGRLVDILGDLAVIGPMVSEWVAGNRIAGTLAELAVAHPGELITDLAAVASGCGWRMTVKIDDMAGVVALAPRLQAEALLAVIRISPAEVPRFLPIRDGALLTRRVRDALGVPAD